MKPAAFRKRPVVIYAVQFDGTVESYQSICAAFPDRSREILPMDRDGDRLGRLGIPTLEGGHIASPGDWIIQGVKGELYPCKPDIFEMTYERVEPLN